MLSVHNQRFSPISTISESISHGLVTRYTGYISAISNKRRKALTHNKPPPRLTRLSVTMWGWGTPLPPLSIYFLIFSPFYFFLSFIGFTYFLLLSILSLSTRIVPLRFQAVGRRRRLNLGCFFVLFFFVLFFLCVCNLCYLYSLVKMHCGVFWFTFVCSFSALTLLVGSFDP